VAEDKGVKINVKLRRWREGAIKNATTTTRLEDIVAYRQTNK
jgi:hypothetical protein